MTPDELKRPLRRRFIVGVVVGILVGLVAGFNAGFLAVAHLSNRISRLQTSQAGTETQVRLAKPTLRIPDTPVKLNFGLRLEDEAGQPVSLGVFRGKLVFLNLWATYCGPCLAEMPALSTLYKTLGGNPRFAFVSVAKDDGPTISRFLAKQRPPFPVYRLPEGSELEGSGTAVPVTLIVGRDGKVLARIVGAADWADSSFVAELQALIEN